MVAQMKRLKVVMHEKVDAGRRVSAQTDRYLRGVFVVAQMKRLVLLLLLLVHVVCFLLLVHVLLLLLLLLLVHFGRLRA